MGVSVVEISWHVKLLGKINVASGLFLSDDDYLA
jgi:hypothetical protein